MQFIRPPGTPSWCRWRPPRFWTGPGWCGWQRPSPQPERWGPGARFVLRCRPEGTEGWEDTEDMRWWEENNERKFRVNPLQEVEIYGCSIQDTLKQHLRRVCCNRYTPLLISENAVLLWWCSSRCLESFIFYEAYKETQTACCVVAPVWCLH